MQHLIDSTHDTHYERFRFAKLASMGSGGVSASEINLMVQFEKEKASFVFVFVYVYCQCGSVIICV